MIIGHGDRRPAGKAPLPPWAAAAAALLLMAAAALPYLAGGGMENFIALDDDVYVYENPVVLQGLSPQNVRWAFTTFYEGNWHPLAWVSHMADVTLFGLDARRHHLVNVLLHSLNTALLFLALNAMTAAPGPSAFAAALFALHPLHVESVAWVAERKDVLSGLFFMLLLFGYGAYARRGGAARYIAVFVILTVGLTAKPTLVTAPLVLLLLDLWPLGRTSLAPPADGGPWRPVPHARLLWEKVPLLAPVLACSVLTYMAPLRGGYIVSLDYIPAGARLANALVAYVSYMGKAALPLSLAVHYPHPLSYPWWEVAASLLVLAAATVLSALQLRRRPFLLAGWLWYLAMLAPMIGLVQVGVQAMADRYTYLPLTGVFLMLSWGVAGLGRPRAAAAGAAALLLFFGSLSVRQAGLWSDSETLFRHALETTEGNWPIHTLLGKLFFEEGRTEEAETQYTEALRLTPSLPVSHYNLGLLLHRYGRLPEAESRYLETLSLDPGLAEAHFSLGNLLAEEGRAGEAETEYLEALRIGPALPEYHGNLGNLLAATGRVGEAAARYGEALRLAPSYAEAHSNLGILLAGAGRVGEAEARYREALRLDPGLPEAHLNLANLLADEGRLREAAVHYRNALAARPDWEGAHRSLAAVLEEEGLRGEAALHRAEAERLRAGEAE